MSKYTTRTELDILSSAPLRNGLVAISTDSKKLFVSYNGEWRYRKEISPRLDVHPDRLYGFGQEIKPSEDGYSTVMGLSSGSPVGWWKSTDVFAAGPENNPRKYDRVDYWKSLISDYAFINIPTNSFGGGGGSMVQMAAMTTFQGNIPAIRMGSTSTYGSLSLNRPLPQVAPAIGDAGGYTFFFVARSTDNYIGLMYWPNVYWDATTGPWRAISSSYGATGVGATQRAQNADTTDRPGVFTMQWNFSDGASNNIDYDFWHNTTNVLDKDDIDFKGRSSYYALPRIGTHGENVGWGSKNLYYYELIIYDSYLSTTDRESVMNYLLDKYGR